MGCNHNLMVIFICVRGSTTAHFVLFWYYSSREELPALRVTLHAGKPLLYESLLFEKEEFFHSTSPYSSRRKNTSTLRVITFHAGKPLLYESVLSIGNPPALRVTGPVLLSIGNTPALWQSCGKPSTKFPHGELVECPPISPHFLTCLFLKNKISEILISFICLQFFKF